MPLTATLMSVIEATWQVSAGTVKYLLLALLIFSAYRIRPGNLAEIRETLLYGLKQLILHRKQTLIYSLLGGGIILTILPSQPVFAYIITSAGFGYTFIKFWKARPEPVKPSYRRAVTVFLTFLLVAALIIDIAAVVTNFAILDSLAALYLYSLVFWKL